MPMRIFVCAGEPSGDLHAGNLVRALRQQDPTIECLGYGGEHLARAGGRLLFPLCDLAVMWFGRVLAHAPTFLRLLYRADRYFCRERPDAVVLIDYPGFNWWLARRARAHGIPVFYFVPPQLWAWAGWRVRKMRRLVDHVLCTLPFEEPWYRQRGVAAHYVGHPYFDELPRQQLEALFLAEHSQGGPIIGVLPGSRTQEVSRNLPTLVRAAQHIHAARPDCRFLAACYRPAHGDMVQNYLAEQPPLPLEVCVGRTPEIIQLAHSCVAVSGSVGLELLYRGKPTVVVYRISRLDLRLARLFMTTRYISLVNLLAEREVFPEFLSGRCPAAEVAEQVVTWLNDQERYQQVCAELAALRQRVAEPGACQRTARFILDRAG